MTRLISLVCAALTTATAAIADDPALYAEPAPKDAGFVRLVGFAPGSAVAFGGLNLVAPKHAGTYIAISAARSAQIEAGQYLSVLNADAPRVIAEPGRETQAKVHLLIVNGSDEPLSLKLADGSMTVIDTVAPGMSLSRAVNPVSAALGVFGADDDVPLATFDVALRRGQNVSFIAHGGQVDMTLNRFGPVVK